MMKDVINGVPRELLERVRYLCEYWFTRECRAGMSESEYKIWHALGFGSRAYTKLRAILSEQKSSQEDNPQSSAAQSAPAGEREAFSAEYDAIGQRHIYTNREIALRMFQAGAAWQRTQSAGVPFTWVAILNGKKATEGSERHCRDWAEAWNASPSSVENVGEATVAPLFLAAAPAQPAAQESAAPICPNCDGSGEVEVWSDNSPDAHITRADCPHCLGSGDLEAAYRALVDQLAASRSSYMDLAGELYFLKHGNQPAAHDQGEVQRLREALEMYAAVYNEHWKPGMPILEPISDTALAASTGQEVKS